MSMLHHEINTGCATGCGTGCATGCACVLVRVRVRVRVRVPPPFHSSVTTLAPRNQ